MAPVLALRFRDLVTGTGETIRLHQEFVKRGGYCWWAWWKKGSEEVPRATWGDLNRSAIQEGPLPILLIDSGDRKLYHAKLHEIDYDNGTGPRPAPEAGQHTPEYYSRNKYSAWMKISDITPGSPEDIKRYTWLDVPAGPPLSADTNQAFRDKRVFDLHELIQFNVTWWLLRSATSSDSTIQVVLAAPRRPELLSADAVDCPGNALLHLSDLHLSLTHHAFPLRPERDVRPTLAGAIETALRGHNNELRIGGVVVTGDLTWSASEEEFGLVESELSELARLLGIDRRHIVVVPGNHDITWATPDPGVPPNLYAPVSEEHRAHYRAFLRSFYGSEPADTLTMCRRMLFSTTTVDLVGVDSCGSQQYQGLLAGVGYIGDSLHAGAKVLGWTSGPRRSRWRIVALHHHIIPVVGTERLEDAPRGFGLASDAEAFSRRALDFGVDLVIHGHQHQPALATLTRTSITGTKLPDRQLAIAGGGSCGVTTEHLGPVRQRTFGVLEFRSDDTGETIDYHLFKTGDRSDTEFSIDSRLRYERSGPWRRQP